MPCTPTENVLPISLGALFAPLPIVSDRDGDGLIDSVNLRIVVDRALVEPVLWAAILNLTARLAFVSLATDLPLVTTIDKTPHGLPLLRVQPPRHRSGAAMAEIRRLNWRNPLALVLRGTDPACMADLLDCLDAQPAHAEACPAEWHTLRLHRPGADIEYLDGNGCPIETFPRCCAGSDLPEPKGGQTKEFGPLDLIDIGSAARWFEADAGDLRRVRLGLRVHLASTTLSRPTGLALGRALVRLVAQVTQMPLFPVTAEAPPCGVPLLRIVEHPSVKGRQAEAAVVKTCDGEDAAPEIMIQGVARSLPKAIDAWLSLALCQAGPQFAAVQGFRKEVAEFKAILDGEGFWGRWAHALAAEHPPETSTWPALAAQPARQIAKACRCVQLPAPVSRTGLALRRSYQWSNEIDRLLEQVTMIPEGRGPLSGTLFASKPEEMRSALAERVTAALSAKGYTPTLSVCNAYKPGLCWLMEKVLPRLVQSAPVQRIELRYQPFAVSAAQLELRSRWLQEIFPGPDLLAQTLGLDLEDIVLTEAPAAQAGIYRLRAWRDPNELLLDDSFSPLWNAMPYRLHDSGQGYIHPTTAGLRLHTPSAVLVEIALPTDRQVFWSHFQQEWLPLLEAHMRARLADGIEMQDAAFWDTIRIDVAIDETDVRLGLDRERICPMEALHEDLYFFLLNAFQHFAAEHNLPDTIGLGAVLPMVAAHTTWGTPRAVMTARPLSWPRAPRGVSIESGATLATMASKRSGQWEVCFTGVAKAVATPKLAAIARAWGYRCRYASEGFYLELALPQSVTPVPVTGPQVIPTIPTARYLSLAEADDLLDALDAQARLHVWRAGNSLRGRPIRVVEAVSVPPTDVLSVARLRLLKPTLLINARHHANEISSTPAVLRFLADLAGGRLSDLLRRANVVAIPMENMDGVATFEAIAAQGRDHKLHAARYNAVGAEFYADYFKSPPRFSEAEVKPLLWRRWLPELMVDLHGVPGHEWDQPFAGYAPARFEQYWIPSTFVYVILPFLEEEHPLHPAAHRLLTAMRQALGLQEAIIRSNRRLAGRYRRYARGPEPDIFPAADDDILIALPPLGRTRDVNFARRYPHVTQSEIVVEVPDEGSDGPALQLCAQAHYTIQEALLGALDPVRHTLVVATCDRGREVGWQVARIDQSTGSGFGAG
jgi:hypothetical protein